MMCGVESKNRVFCNSCAAPLELHRVFIVDGDCVCERCETVRDAARIAPDWVAFMKGLISRMRKSAKVSRD